MTTSECYILHTNLVKEANKKVLNNDKMQVNYFIPTSYLLEYNLLEVDYLIKSQDIRSKSIEPKICINSSTEKFEFIVPSTVLVLEEDSKVDISLHKDTARHIKIIKIVN